MKIRRQVLVGLALLCTTVALASAQQSTPVDEQALKKEVNAFMDQVPGNCGRRARSINLPRASITRLDS